ncbi:hypothetical protein QU481_15510 [Crenobacter sp. SG2303]|uniref:Uncharacterized protein n=1 Tax=Crenobacter oryzisoli TaxID=3056844 RepID=A0ABT7XMV6_9NEIS|nr:hypothetical protein [Crenobacter sp. SG2303]MDN0075100.1 hypothetical protein [Crenobacter sp. SG2303]MDN0076292.1 hypothetical protein [Crenobacter sp. SG2303]
MALVNWSLSIQVTGGPTVSVTTNPNEVQATDRIEVTIKAGDKDKIVMLQPEPASGIHLLLIKSSYYGADLTFKVSDGQKDGNTQVKLLGPQFFSGGAVGLFDVSPNQLKITNNSAKDSLIEIFIARDATP